MTYTKKSVSLGAPKLTNMKNVEDNFTTLFDAVDDAFDAIGAKEPSITKKTAFNQNFETNSANVKMDGVASAGTSNNVARADHAHPHDNSKQNNAPDGTNQIIKDGKFNMAYMPDEILGQLSYKGTFAPSSSVAAASNPQKGDYYIANAVGSFNPDCTAASNAYGIGDWAVYNGTAWDKVDNTDAVTLVNGQKGSVETYKGEWQAGVQGYKGDTVLYNGVLYLLTADLLVTPSHTPDIDTANYKAYGITTLATYTSDGLMSMYDKITIKICDDERHTHNNKALLDTYTQTEANLSEAVAQKHTHDNKDILDATTASFTYNNAYQLSNIKIKQLNILTTDTWSQVIIDSTTYYAHALDGIPFVPLRAYKTISITLDGAKCDSLVEVDVVFIKPSPTSYLLSTEKFDGMVYLIDLAVVI